MTKDNGISIIIPCYNSGEYLKEGIESIYAQGLNVPYEIIVVDDGSYKKSTFAALKEIETMPRVRLFLSSPNMGVSVARNIALQNAQYAYIFPLDSDDMLSTDRTLFTKDGGYLQRSIKILSENPDVLMTSCNLKRFGSTDMTYEPNRMHLSDKTLLCYNNIGCFSVFRRDEALAVGGYNEDLRKSEDRDLNITLMNLRHKQGRPGIIHRMEEQYYLYRRRADKTNLTCQPQGNRFITLAKTIQRNPEIYAHHFPGLIGRELIDEVGRIEKTFSRGRALALLFHSVADPIDAYKDGTHKFVVLKTKEKIAKRFKQAAAQFAKMTLPKNAFIQPETIEIS